MTCVIDASVFVASAQANEAQHGASIQFIQALQHKGSDVFCPTLIIAECAAAIARPTGNPELANEIVSLIKEFPNLRLIDVTLLLAEKASQIAIQHRLRGADSIYVALAAELDATLVTLDNEMLQRSGAAVKTLTPTDWVTQNP